MPNSGQKINPVPVRARPPVISNSTESYPKSQLSQSQKIPNTGKIITQNGLTYLQTPDGKQIQVKITKFIFSLHRKVWTYIKVYILDFLKIFD